MPGIVKVKVIEGRNLPVMDRSGDTTDAYVELKLGSITYKTEVCRKTLNPQWNSEWYRFEVDDSELQDEPLQVRLMDYDTYSANDMIGKVYFNLNPLLLNTYGDSHFNTFKSEISPVGSAYISGWFPVYDTIHGLRGDIYIVIKLELFSDTNKFRQSSCGIQLFISTIIPHGFNTETIFGLVEELVYEEDPEYQWIEKIRTPRASNEARQSTFYRMSGELQRKIGIKVIEMGGNAVIGYRQCFDIEGESGGVVVRGIGTAVKLVKILEQENTNEEYEAPPIDDITTEKVVDGRQVEQHRQVTTTTTTTRRCQSDSGANTLDDDNTVIITTADAQTTSVFNTSDHNVSYIAENVQGTPPKYNIPRYNVMYRDVLDTMEYPFLTLSKYPPDFILRIGGTVCSRSVKLLTRSSNVEEPETRDAWWTELRVEIKSHMKALACNVVLNYVENTSICDEVCVLNACGTAAVVRFFSRNSSECSCGFECACNLDIARRDSVDAIESPSKVKSCSSGNVSNESPYHNRQIPITACSVYHVPYKKSNIPFHVKLRNCSVCQKASVPDMLFATIEPLDNMPVIGQAAFIHAFVYRLKKDCKSDEMNAREISDGLPFLEYELNKQLVNKLRIKGMNSLFGLNTQISVGEKMISAYATATAIFLSPLPSPPEPSLIIGKSWESSSSNHTKLLEAKKKLQDALKRNRMHYELSDQVDENKLVGSVDNSEHNQELDFYSNCKQTCIIELDDDDDIDLICQLLDPNPQQGFIVSATECLPGVTVYEPVSNIQLFAQVWRSRIPTNTPPSSFNKLFYRIVQGLYIKVHNRIPCSLSKITFKMDIPEPDELQICIIGMAVALKESEKHDKTLAQSTSNMQSEDIPYILDEGKDFEPLPLYVPSKKSAKKHNQPWDKVDITSLSYIPDGTIRRYLGNLDFIFIRESAGVRETGGINNFVHNFLADVVSIVKSHVMGIGGNGMVSFFLNQCVLVTHKNQGQCLVHVGGDAVSYIRNKPVIK